MTVRYILTELDEQEREEMFRLKRFKEKKHKKKAPPAEANLALEEPDENDNNAKLIETINEIELQVKLIKPEEIIEPEEVIEPKTIIEPEEIPEVKSKQKLRVSVEKVPEIKELQRRKSDVCVCEPPQSALETEKLEKDDKLELLKKHLEEMIVLSRLFLEKGFKSGCGKKFISTCNEAQREIDQLLEGKDQPPQVDENLNNRLVHLKRHLREMIDVISEFYDEPLAPSDFKYPCNKVDEEKYPCSLEKTTPRTSISEEDHTEEFKNHIEEIVKLIEDYKKEGPISESVEAFLTSCDHVKSKINIYAKESDGPRNQKLDFLRKQVTFVEKSANYFDQEGMKDFLCSCKNFKGKLDEYKQQGQNPPEEGGLAKLVSQIDKTMELSQEAKKEGFESENLDFFLQSCDDMKTHIESKNILETKEQPKCIKQIKSNINDIIMLVSKCRAEGTLTESAEAFIQSCEKAKTKLDDLGKHSETFIKSCEKAKTKIDDIGKHSDLNEQVGIGTCVCDHPKIASNEILCDKCAGEVKKEPDTVHLKPPLCNNCKNSLSGMLTETVMHDICLQDPFDEVEWFSYASAKASEENTCLLCKGSNKDDTCKGHQDHVPEGYLQVLTTIKRTHHFDGSVKEVRETITIKNEKNKHKAALLGDDHDTHGTDHVKDSLFEVQNKAHTCITPNQNQSGFTRCIKKATSEKIKGNAPMTEPCSKQCISMNNLVCSNKNQPSHDILSVESSDFIFDLIDTDTKSGTKIWKNKPTSSKKND